MTISRFTSLVTPPLMLVLLVCGSNIALIECFTIRNTYNHRSTSNNALFYQTNAEFTKSNSDDSSNHDTDWFQAELTVRKAPSEPHPSLDAETVATAFCRSLQWVDYPTEMAGLKRCFPFMTYGCREVVTARRGGKTLASFLEYSLLAPAFQPFMGATRIEIGECTHTAAKAPLRGALASFPIQIYGAPSLRLQHLSVMDRGGVTEGLPVTNMVLRLEQQRRPPHQHCWLVTEVLDVRHAFAGDMGNVHVGG